ncbi:MAG: hypothetical protein M0Q95_00630 [Porticoccaceae bacterium]|nr:hypothetical protein [Porticoccaceae bacterium]
MFRMFVMAAALLTASISVTCSAAGLATPEQARDFGNEVVMAIGKGNLTEAWMKMKTNTTIPPGRIDTFAAGYNSQVNQTIKYYGPSIGMELISAELTGESLLRLTYLIKYEVTGVSWFLTFYKGRDNWVLTDFNYDININSIFYD